MTEHNHRRGTRGPRDRSGGRRWGWGGMPSGEAKEWQRIHHGEVRAEVRDAMHAGNYDELPPDRPRTIRWDYW